MSRVYSVLSATITPKYGHTTAEYHDRKPMQSKVYIYIDIYISKQNKTLLIAKQAHQPSSPTIGYGEIALWDGKRGGIGTVR